MKNAGLIFIPDISGFTRFVNQTEIGHSSHIISELLEILIDTNQLGMEMIEIEGDAILFFKSADIPSLEALIIQAETMFINFHKHLKRYESERICRCGACRTAINLSLKFIIHLDEVKPIQVGSHKKLHGKSVIFAHRLLKNDLKLDEYILLTRVFEKQITDFDHSKLLNPYAFESLNMNLKDFEENQFYYIHLDKLKSQLPKLPSVQLSKAGTYQTTSEISIECNIDQVYEYLSELHHRVDWNPRIKKIFLKNEKINKAGAVHSCLIGKSELEVKSLGRMETESSIEYGERTDNYLFFDQLSTFYILKAQGNTTLVTAEMHYELKAFYRPFDLVIRQMLISMNRKNLKHLMNYSEKK